MSKGRQKGKRPQGKPGSNAGPRVLPPAAADPQDDAYSDHLIAEVAELDDHLVVPPGAPAMMDFHQLNRRRRAELTATLRRVMPQAERFDEQARKRLAAAADDPGGAVVTDESLEDGEAMFTFIADVEDLLAIVAFDTDAFHRWANDPATSDEDLLAVFSRFSRRLRLGEANSSST